MGVIYYLINHITLNKTSFFGASEWSIYSFTLIFSIGGVMTGSKLSNFLKDKLNIIRGKLRILLVLCGISLLIYSLASGL